MDELKWELPTEVQGRLEADLLKIYFEAYGIDVELFQESVGHHIWDVPSRCVILVLNVPVTVRDMTGKVMCSRAQPASI